MKSENAERMVYSIPQVAAALGISTRSAYELARRRDFPAIRLTPHRIVVSRLGLEEWIQRQLDEKVAK